MIRSKENGLTIFRWSSLEGLGINAFTAAAVNTAFHAPGQESEAQILKNRTALSNVAGVEPESWVCGSQVHSSNAALIRSSHRGRGALSGADALPETDALILTEPGLNGMIFTADCLPVILFDTKQKTGALIHAGWRGAASGIVLNALDKMIDATGSQKRNILALTGPAIDACCYQVDLPVYKAMTEGYPETEAAFTPDGPGHWRFSLEQAVFLQLNSRGIGPAHCEGSGLCSCCNNELFSWRREGTETGRMATCLCL